MFHLHPFVQEIVRRGTKPPFSIVHVVLHIFPVHVHASDQNGCNSRFNKLTPGYGTHKGCDGSNDEDK